MSKFQRGERLSQDTKKRLELTTTICWGFSQSRRLQYWSRRMPRRNQNGRSLVFLESVRNQDKRVKNVYDGLLKCKCPVGICQPAGCFLGFKVNGVGHRLVCFLAGQVSRRVSSLSLTSSIYRILQRKYKQHNKGSMPQ